MGTDLSRMFLLRYRHDLDDEVCSESQMAEIVRGCCEAVGIVQLGSDRGWPSIREDGPIREVHNIRSSPSEGALQQ